MYDFELYYVIVVFYLQGVSLGSIQESFNSSREESLDCGEGDSFADDDNHSNAAVSYSYLLYANIARSFCCSQTV